MPDPRFHRATMLGPSPLTCIISDPNETDLDPLGESCCICYHAYSFGVMYPGAEEPIQLECGHIFGEKCLSKWISTNSTCPLCRCHAQLACQNDADQILDERLSYDEDFSWSHDMGYEMGIDGESEAEDEFFDAQEEIVTPQIFYHLSDEDMWLTVAYEEKTSRYAPAKSSFAPLVEPVVFRKDCFDELTNCHEQWMTDSLYENDGDGEYAVSYFDVFPY
jgi:hypothetical protein